LRNPVRYLRIQQLPKYNVSSGKVLFAGRKNLTTNPHRQGMDKTVGANIKALICMALVPCRQFCADRKSVFQMSDDGFDACL
jgi:hypothetical protein